MGVKIKTKNMDTKRMGKWVVDKNEVKVKWPRYRKLNSPLFIYSKSQDSV
jgi:hypothetical protein